MLWQRVSYVVLRHLRLRWNFRFFGKSLHPQTCFVKGLFYGFTLVLFTWFFQVFLGYSNKGKQRDSKTFLCLEECQQHLFRTLFIPEANTKLCSTMKGVKEYVASISLVLMLSLSHFSFGCCFNYGEYFNLLDASSFIPMIFFNPKITC